MGVPAQFVLMQDATTTSNGAVALSGDLAGTAAAPSVVKLNGVAITGIPAAGQVPTASSATTAAWATPAGASSTAKRVVTGTWASTVAPNSATTDIYRVILGGNTTINVPTGTPVDGQQMQLHLIQDGTGSRTVTWGAGFKFGSTVTAPTLTTTASATDIVGIQYSASATLWRVLGVALGY